MRMNLAAAIVAAFLLSGCAGITGPVDGMIGKLEGANDTAIAAVDAEADRLRRSKCLFPFTALVRYVRSSAEAAARVRTDCGLVVRPDQAEAE